MDFYTYVSELEHLVMTKLLPAYKRECRIKGLDPKLPQYLIDTIQRKAQIPALFKPKKFSVEESSQV